MRAAEAKRIMEIYKARENGIDFAIKIMELVDDKEEKPTADKKTVRREKKTEEPRICPECGKRIKGRGNKKVCDDCKAKKVNTVEDDLKATAKELAELAR